MEKMQYSPLSDSAAYAVASNGTGILKMPKYAGKIKKTIIRKRKSGWLELYWVDAADRIVYEKSASFITEADLGEFPMIGEIVRTEE